MTAHAIFRGLAQYSAWRAPLVIGSIIYLTFWTSPPAWPAVAAPFESIHVFGDSLTAIVGGPYFQSRWCNGPVWPEHVASKWGLTSQSRNNHAQGLATSQGILRQASSLPNDALNESFCAVFAGAWDFGPQLHQAPDISLWSSLAGQVVGNCSNVVLALHGKGARTIAVLNQPDFMRFPEFAALTERDKVFFRARIIEFNTSLRAAMSALQFSRPDLVLYDIDVFALFDPVLDQPDTYGFTETAISVIHDPRLANKAFDGPGRHYLFWDPISITSKMHSMIADWIDAAVQGTQLSLTRSNSGLLVSSHRLLIGRTYIVQSSTDAVTWLVERTEQALLFESDLLPIDRVDPPLRLFRLQYVKE